MKCTRGSALLFVILSLALVTLYMTGIIRTASLSIDFASHRTDHIKRQYIRDGLCEYATVWVLDNFDGLVDQLATTEKVKKSIKWPSQSKDAPQGMLKVRRKKDTLCLDLTLTSTSAKKEIGTLAWSVTKKNVDADTVQFYIEKYTFKQA